METMPDGRYQITVEKGGLVYQHDLIRSGASNGRFYEMVALRGREMVPKEKRPEGVSSPRFMLKPRREDIEYMFDGKPIPLFVMNGRAYKFKYGKGKNPWEGTKTETVEPEPKKRPPREPPEKYVRVSSLRSELEWSDVDFINTASSLGIVAREFVLDGFRTPCVTREEYRKLRKAKRQED